MQPDRRKHSRIICAFSMGTAEVSVCLFVLSSFSPVMIGWYLQAVSTYKMTQMAVFPYDMLPLCSSVEYFTPASTLVLLLRV